MPSTIEVAQLYALNPAERIDLVVDAHESPKAHGEALYNAIQSDIFLVRLEQIAWAYYRDKLNGKGEEKDGPLQAVVSKIISDTGLREVIVNTVVQIYEKNFSRASQSSGFCTAPITARLSKDEPIDSIRVVRIEWEQGINEELAAIAQEMARPFVQARAPGIFGKIVDGDIVLTNSTQPGGQGQGQGQGQGGRETVRFLFDSEDLLETGVGIRSANAKAEFASKMLGMVKLFLHTPSLYDFQKKYADLSPMYTQLGIEDKRLSTGGHKFMLARHEEGEAIASYGTAIEARTYLRRGVPHSLRGRLWRIALALPDAVTSREVETFSKLKKLCETTDLITDMLYLFDVENVIDDPRFFVFEEELKECVLCFSRDQWVYQNSAYVVHAPIDAMASGFSFASASAGTTSASASGAAGAAAAADSVGYPPPCSNVQPFLGFSIYIAPLCFMYPSRPSLYSVSRCLWARLWCKMNVISGDSGTLIHVCATFENLLVNMHPTLFLHLLKIGVQPLLIAMPWLQFGFVGLLEMEQVMYLWDRLIGYEDPCILAVVAVAIFLTRSEAVLTTTVPAEAVQMLMEGTRLKVVSLLQMVLFTDNASAAADNTASSRDKDR